MEEGVEMGKALTSLGRVVAAIRTEWHTLWHTHNRLTHKLEAQAGPVRRQLSWFNREREWSILTFWCEKMKRKA